MSMRRRSSSSIEGTPNKGLLGSIINTNWVSRQPSSPGSLSLLDHGIASLVTEKKQVASPPSTLYTLFLLVLIIFPWLPAAYMDYKTQSLQEQVQKLQSESMNDVLQMAESIQQKTKIIDMTKKLETENKELLSALKLHGDLVDPENNVYAQAQILEEQFMDRITDLEHAIQKQCQMKLQTTFDVPDLKRLQLQYEIVLREETSGKEEAFVLETHNPLPQVAHTALVFHQLVESEYFINATAEHKDVTIMASCLRIGKEVMRSKRSNLETIMYEEKARKKEDSLAGKRIVSLVKKGVSTTLMVCLGGQDVPIHHDEMESVFGRLVAGAQVVQSLHRNSQGYGAGNWTVKSAKHIQTTIADPPSSATSAATAK